MRYLIVTGSPLRQGRSAQIAHHLTELLSSADATVACLDVGTHPVDPCIACDRCKETYRCVLQDRLQTNYPLVEEADVVIVVSPVYFAGPTAQIKAFLDRMQPYFWDEARRELGRKAFLFVVREGGDPHGYEPLVTIVKSSMAVAGFKLEDHFDCIGVYEEELKALVTQAAAKIEGRV